MFLGVSRGGTGLLVYLERPSKWPDLSTSGVLRAWNVDKNVDNWPAPGPGRPFFLMLTKMLTFQSSPGFMAGCNAGTWFSYSLIGNLLNHAF